MRRMIASGGVGALLTVLILGTFQATAAAPYVYGCTPASFNNGGNISFARIYNGQTSTANVTFKAIAFDGTNLNSALSLTTNITVAAGKTNVVTWTSPNVNPDTNNTAPLTLRLVSDQSIEASVTVSFGATQELVPCTYLHP